SDPAGRKSIRGAAYAGIPNPADEGALFRGSVPERRNRSRLSPLPAAVGEFESALYQPRGPDAPAVRVLRILRALRLRALRESEPADDHPASPAQESQLRAANKLSGATGQPRQHRKEGYRRHLWGRR